LGIDYCSIFPYVIIEYGKIMKRIRVLIALLLACMAFTAAVPVQAADLTISHMEIDIWPEYDQPSVLVIFRISYASMTNFPTRVSLRIPASAGNPYSVAMKDLDGLLYDLEYSVVPDGRWNRIEFVTSTPDLQIEFYEPYTQHADASRGYTFNWISDYASNELNISIQKPRYASTMSIFPSGGEGTVNPDDGLTYFSIAKSGLEQGAILNVVTSYIKVSGSLSASTVPVKAVSPLPQPQSVWQTLISVFPSIWQNKNIVIAGALLLAGLILFNILIAVVRGPARKRDRQRLLVVGSQKGQKNTKEIREVYCHHCGKRARPGDAFCRTCGSKLVE
jgi:hypothetical protein